MFQTNNIGICVIIKALRDLHIGSLTEQKRTSSPYDVSLTTELKTELSDKIMLLMKMYPNYSIKNIFKNKYLNQIINAICSSIYNEYSE